MTVVGSYDSVRVEPLVHIRFYQYAIYNISVGPVVRVLFIFYLEDKI